MDWHEIKDPRWRGAWLIVYEDDASRLITGFGVYQGITSQSSASALEHAIIEHQRPASLLTYNGTTFYSSESEARENGITEFERCIIKNRIRFISRVQNKQASGKIDRFFSFFEKVIRHFSSIGEFVTWYNCQRPHGTLGLKTPLQVFYKKLPELDHITYPAFMESQESR